MSCPCLHDGDLALAGGVKRGPRMGEQGCAFNGVGVGDQRVGARVQTWGGLSMRCFKWEWVGERRSSRGPEEGGCRKERWEI